jgi:hypothetical protein
MLALAASIRVLNTALQEGADGRDKPDHDGRSVQSGRLRRRPKIHLTCQQRNAFLT